MPSIEWYYAKNDQPCGPVSPIELKKFAVEGEVHEEDLVWREGMGEWMPAGKIKGLFDDVEEQAERDTPAAKEKEASDDSVSRGEVPAKAIPKPPSPAVELSIRVAPSGGGWRQAEQPARTSPEDRIEPFRHPFDSMADLAREHFGAHFIHSTVVLFRVAGQLGTFLAIVGLLALAWTYDDGPGTLQQLMPAAVVASILLLVMQYSAGRLFATVVELDAKASGPLSATALLDCLAWGATALGLIALVGLTTLAITGGAVWPAVLAIGLFVPCQFAAVACWNPLAIGLCVGPVLTPGRETIGLAAFVGKLLWRLGFVGFGVGMVLGGLAALNAAAQLGMADEPELVWFGLEARVPVWVILAVAPLPLVGYVAFLLCQLVSELFSAWLDHPGSLR